MSVFIVKVRRLLHPFNPRWLFKTKTINAPLFLESWEARWGKVADPTNEEVLQRLKQLSGGTVAEIGAGYGRVTSYLAERGMVVWPFEPNEYLAKEILPRVYEVGEIKTVTNARAGFITQVPVDYYFSVRALEYCNFVELIRMSAKLKAYGVHLIAWERKRACARIRIAGWITFNQRIFTQNLIT
ncbi:methyltransferase [Candidatus Planktophila versatilis]|uniref:hypothetical protein n=1 Tax=Candidatus Planktophila versatilis TaxID=1884905 RepID=UPI000BAC5ABD|nr:hypothetical protein [Candidatus Planktophila versatilis]ASY18017.1 methyltransferase [Candidatus Planktophila versatilis]